MKTAKELVDEILWHVDPPKGHAVVLIEALEGEPNWIASIGSVDLYRLEKFTRKVTGLRRSDRLIDWSAVTEREGKRRRIAQSLSSFQNDSFEPETITGMVAAYEDALRSLGVADRMDPIAEIVAKAIIKFAQHGERDPVTLRDRALDSLRLN